MYRMTNEQRLALVEMNDLIFRAQQNGAFAVINYSSYGSIVRVEVNSAPLSDPLSQQVVKSTIHLARDEALSCIEEINETVRGCCNA